MLAFINVLGIFLSMYVLISKKYRTKSIDTTLVFISLNVIFTCKLWLVLSEAFIGLVMYSMINYLTFGMLLVLMYGVKKTDIPKDIASYRDRLKHIFRPILNKFKALIKHN